MTPSLLGRLLDEHGPALTLFARQWCETPEDVVQEALIKLAQQRRVPDRPAAWLYRVVRNLAVSARRAAQRRRRREQHASSGEPAWFVPSHEDRLDAQAATEALRELPAGQREVIVARLWGGLTFEEIAGVVRCSSSAAHRRYAAGIKALRDRLGVTWEERRTAI